ncbi:MAG: hypothetical protein IID41_09915 [Planctomycetes bacterium]|nr:hypothetical protein [Planctomycetota bacterium]
MKREKIKRRSGARRAAGAFKEPQALACAIAPARLVCLALLSAVLCGGQLACAPTKLLDPPAGWPVEWKNRKLFNTPNAYIYAGNAAAAGQVDAIAERVNREFQKRTDGRLVKGLLLVNDVNEEPVIADHEAYTKLMLNRSASVRNRALTDAQLEAQYTGIRQTMADRGTQAEMELLMTPVSLGRLDLTRMLGFENSVSDSVAWSAVISTTALIEYANRENMQSELHHRKIGLVLQVPLAPIILFEERLRNAKAFVARDVAVFRSLAHQQAAWSEAKRQDETLAYMERKLNETLLPVITQLRDVLKELAAQIEPLLPGAESEQRKQGQQD